MKKYISVFIVLAILMCDSIMISATDEIENDTYICAEYVWYIEEICDIYNVSPELIEAIVEMESAGNPDVVSPHGAVGLMQIIPKYQEERMERLGVYDLYDPYSNILVGVDFIRQLFEDYGEVYDVLMFYNDGYQGVEKSRKLEFSEYAEKITKRAEELSKLHYGL